MAASSTIRQPPRPTRWGRWALGLSLVLALICCAWPAVSSADDAATYDPFDVESFEFAQRPTFDPFEIQPVAHVEQPLQPSQSNVQHLPAVKLADPFDEVVWSAPLGETNYAPPVASAVALPSAPAAVKPLVADKPEAMALPTLPPPQSSYTQVAQLELSSPSDQDEAEGYAASAREWAPKPLDQLTINIAEPAGVTPRDYAGERPIERWPCDPTLSTRCWPMLTYQWAATCLCYQPLYFEEINLERYGYGCGKCLQPAASAAHFFGTVPILPYCMAVNCPGECNYTLGEYRPGSCAPWRTTCPGPSAIGGLTEAGVVVGLVLLIP